MRGGVVRRGGSWAVALTVMVLAGPRPAAAREWLVAVNGTDANEGCAGGTAEAPFRTIRKGLECAGPGDVVTVQPGTYTEQVETVRGGVSEQQRITIRASRRREAKIVLPTGISKQRVVYIRHPYITFEGFIVDADYSLNRGVELGGIFKGGVTTWADHTILRDCEVTRAARDLVQVNEADGVLIDGCLIHHALRWGPNEGVMCGKGPRCDAHGVTGGDGRLEDLTIRNTEIHTVSGDAVQVDPDRNKLGWNNVRIEHCRLYNRVLLDEEPEGRNGFPAGAMPGEEALDTKASELAPRANLYVTDTVAYGWKNGPVSTGITLPSAWNIKENVKVWFDRVTTYDSNIAFRLRGRSAGRGPAQMQLLNAVIYRTATAIRTENNVGDPSSYEKEKGGVHEPEPPVEIFNVTIGEDTPTPIQLVTGGPVRTRIDLRNFLILGALPEPLTQFPANFPGSNRLSTSASSFVDVSVDDYHLDSRSPAIDAGVEIREVSSDRDGVPRPQGSFYDVGAYERREDDDNHPFPDPFADGPRCAGSIRREHSIASTSFAVSGATFSDASRKHSVCDEARSGRE